MDSTEYTEFLSRNNAIQRITFAIELLRNDYSIESISNLSRNNSMADELLDLSHITMYMKDSYKYTAEWAEKEKATLKQMNKNITSTMKSIIEKMELASMYKSISEDLEYIIGEKSMPHARNVKRLRALRLILEGKSYEEICQILS